MGTYRVEYAKRGQAVCQGPPCKKESVKIGKGELRFGTWVDIGGKFASWKWRHLGCVTSKVLKNMKKEYGNVKDELDGYEDLTADDADKIVKAIENETLEIDDMTPALRPAPKSESADEGDKEIPAKKRKRKTPVKKDDDATSEVSDGDVKPKTAPSPKKTPRKTPAKKAKKKASSESEEEEEEEEIISELSSEESAVETEEEEEEEEEEKPAKKRATSKSTATKKTAAKRTTGRAKPPARNAKSKSKAIVESDVQSEDDSEE